MRFESGVGQFGQVHVVTTAPRFFNVLRQDKYKSASQLDDLELPMRYNLSSSV